GGVELAAVPSIPCFEFSLILPLNVLGSVHPVSLKSRSFVVNSLSSIFQLPFSSVIATRQFPMKFPVIRMFLALGLLPIVMQSVSRVAGRSKFPKNVLFSKRMSSWLFPEFDGEIATSFAPARDFELK